MKILHEMRKVKTIKRVVAGLLTLVLLIPATTFANEPTEEAIVVFEDNVSRSDMQDVTKDVTVTDESKQIALVEGTEEQINEIEQTREVDYVQPNYEYSLLGYTADPYATSQKQWFLNNIKFSQAKETLTTDPTKVTIAVIDTGADISHEDLGCINKEKAKSMTSEGDVQLTGDMSRNSHGTHVCGIIGATTDNGKGGTGVATGILGNANVEIIPINVFEKAGIKELADTNSIVKALNYAKECNADVINMSLGFNGFDQVLENTMKDCRDAGITIVCAGGNDGNDEYTFPSDSKETIGVIWTDQDNTRNKDSNYGENKDISAPGTITSTVRGSYGTLSGTSMASPVVAGCAAIAYSLDSEMTPDKAKDIICKTATDLETLGFDNMTAYGCVNLEGVIEGTQGKLIGSASLSQESYTYNGKPQTPGVTVNDDQGVLLESSNYKVSYEAGRADAGIYNVVVTGVGDYVGTIYKSFRINPASASTSSVKIAKKMTYTGKTLDPVSVNAAYNVSGLDSKIGKHNISIVMKGNYTGKVTSSYTIVPKAPRYKSNKKNGKYRNVRWTKENSTRYQIRYSKYKDFRKYKTRTQTGRYAKVKGKYVKIRCFKTVNNVRYYSEWR